MELNDNLLQLLKNFATINQNILIKQGNEIRTISEARNVLAKATLDINFPVDFGIYDLNEFINVLSLVDTPRLAFNEEYVTIGDSTGRSKVKYFFSSSDTLTSPQKDITMPEPDVSFTLDNDTLNKVRRAASALGHTEVSISGSNGIVNLSVLENQNVTSNSFSIDIDGEYNTENFKFILSINNLKILSGDYDVKISSKLISHFVHKTNNVQYWIALEKSSTYGA